MKLLAPALISGFSVLAFWFLDAAFLSYYQDGATLFSALWADASWLRLLLRLIVSFSILYLAGQKIYAVWKCRNVLNVLQGSLRDNLDRGSAESSNKSCRLLYYSLILAKYLKLAPRKRADLRTLCFCYNIGQVALPSYLLNKKGELSEKEQKTWDSHSERGAEIVAAIPELKSAAPLVMLHREYYNGGGPLGVAGKKIPLACRIFQAVWMFDCMIYPNGQSRPLVFDEALLELRYYEGSALDAEVVEAFIKVMSKKGILAGSGGRVFSWR